MLKMDMKVGQSIRIGTTIITLEDKTGRTARLSIEADSSVPVARVEAKSASQIAAMGIGAKTSVP